MAVNGLALESKLALALELKVTLGLERAPELKLALEWAQVTDLLPRVLDS